MRTYFIIAALLLLPLKGAAQTSPTNEAAAQTYRNTIEFGGGTDYVSNGFGQWSLASLKYSHAGGKLTWFVNTGYLYRKELGGFAFMPSAGAYYDCTDWLYTFASVSSSTKSTYTPSIRGDLDLNFKLGKDRRWVLTLGGSGMDYYNGQSIWIAAAGLTYYHPGVVISYRFMNNLCNPGRNVSHTHLFSIDQGHMGRYMNTLSASYGNLSYMIASPSASLHVERDAFSIYFRHRNWIGQRWGLTGQVSYSNILDAYWTLGLHIGAFFNF